MSEHQGGFCRKKGKQDLLKGVGKQLFSLMQSRLSKHFPKECNTESDFLPALARNLVFSYVFFGLAYTETGQHVL